jgi:hypothetical protein
VSEHVQLVRERRVVEGLLEEDLELHRIHGLGQVIERSLSHGLDGRRHRAVGREDQDDGGSRQLLQFLQQRDAIHLGEHEIGDHDPGTLGRGGVERLLCR